MISRVRSLIKSIWFNFIVFPFGKAIYLPVLISCDVTVRNIRRGCIVIPEKGKLKIGFAQGSFEIGRGQRGFLDFRDDGKIIVADNAVIPAGSIINVAGTLYLGKNFESNANLKVSCGTEIHFGDDMAIGWNVTVIDGDGHDILINGKQSNEDKPIFIGNHVWLCAECTILKGVSIADNCVIGYQSVVSKNITEEGSVVGGNPAKVLRTRVTWVR